MGPPPPAALRRPSVSRSETLPQGQFTAQPLAALPPYGCGVPLAGASAEDVNSRPKGSQTRRRVWDMQTEFNLGKNFL